MSYNKTFIRYSCPQAGSYYNTEMSNTTSRKLNFDAGIEKIDTDMFDLYKIDNFLSKKECETMIKISEKNLQDSNLASPSGDKYFRTSKTCHFYKSTMNSEDYNFIDMINLKICDKMGINPSYSEQMQAQRYTVGQQFKPHTDFFGEKDYKYVSNEQGNRTWTVMVYLNEVEEGGETHMCKIDMNFRPKTGQAIIWNNLNPDRTGNTNTLHAGKPVLKGNKHIITKWFREKSL